MFNFITLGGLDQRSSSVDGTRDGHFSLGCFNVLSGMVGDAGVGKTSLMVRYVEGKFDEDYVETLGVNFLEKTIKLPQVWTMRLSSS